MSVAAEVEKFIVEEIALGTGVDSVGHDEDLLAQDVIDSLGIVELVAFLETRYGIEVADDDLLAGELPVGRTASSPSSPPRGASGEC